MHTGPHKCHDTNYDVSIVKHNGSKVWKFSDKKLLKDTFFQKSEEVCAAYMRSTIVMFMGGIILALAIEYCNLHKRLAIFTIKMVGIDIRRLHFGFVAITTFVSFWIPNTAAGKKMELSDNFKTSEPVKKIKRLPLRL